MTDFGSIGRAATGRGDAEWGYPYENPNEPRMASGSAHVELKADKPADADPMPVFVLKGQDLLALEAIKAYRRACWDVGWDDQASQVSEAILEMLEWQKRNPDKMKRPDHKHVRVTPIRQGPTVHSHDNREVYGG
jgi:hypothetical protein